MTIDGATGLISGIESTGKEANKVVADAFRAGTKLIQQGIQFAVPTAKTEGHTGQRIRDAIGARVKTVRGSGEIVSAKVGVNVGKKNPRQRVKAGETRVKYLARRSSMQARMPKQMAFNAAGWLVTGTQERRTKRGLHRGKVIGNPFVDTGLAITQQSAMELIDKKIHEGVEKLFRGVK